MVEADEVHDEGESNPLTCDRGRADSEVVAPPLDEAARASDDSQAQRHTA